MKAPAGEQFRSIRAHFLRVRPMETPDIRRVMEIGERLIHAPHWPIAAYEAALNPRSEPRRVALVAEQVEEPREPGAPGPENLESGVMQPEALDSGAVAGFVVASLVAGEAELESIAVAAEAQRRGIGGQLLDHLLVELRSGSATRVNLEVRASNGLALGLYRRHGFGETGRRIGYYADPVEDAVLMALDLGGPKMAQEL